MGAMNRTKGQAGEHEIAALIAELTGWEVRRRVRQHLGDGDLEGVPGWSIEVKRHARAPRAEIATWWAQTVRQAELVGATPVLFYRADRDQWRAVWPLAALRADLHACSWAPFELTADTSVSAWAALGAQRRGCWPPLPCPRRPPGSRPGGDWWAGKGVGAASAVARSWGLEAATLDRAEKG